MKKLYLVRHAKSSWDHPDLADFDRPLNDRGKSDAPKMGKRLHKHGVKPHLICSSPAARARATAEIIAHALDYDLQTLRFEKRLYHADPDTFLQVLKAVPEHCGSVMLVGHNPGLTEFADNIANRDLGNIPTAGVVEINLEIKSWKDAAWNCGQLIQFDFPKKEK